MKKVFIVCLALGIVGGLFFANDAAAKTRRAKKPKAVKAINKDPCPPSPYLPKTKGSLAKQNAMIDAFGLPRIKDQEMLEQYFLSGHFVIVSGLGLNITDEVGGYALLPTRDFFSMVGGDFFIKLHDKLKISSLLRTDKEQGKIVEEGRSIADGSSHEFLSSHLAGVAGDISKKTLNKRERLWLIKKLLPYKTAGKIEAIEEMCSNTIHVTVCPNWQTGSCF